MAVETARPMPHFDLLTGIRSIGVLLQNAEPALDGLSNRVYDDWTGIKERLTGHGQSFEVLMRTLYSSAEDRYQLEENEGILIELFANVLWFASNQQKWAARFLEELQAHDMVTGDIGSLKFKEVTYVNDKGQKKKVYKWVIDEKKGGLSADFKKPLYEWYEKIKIMGSIVTDDRRPIEGTLKKALAALDGVLTAMQEIEPLLDDVQAERAGREGNRDTDEAMEALTRAVRMAELVEQRLAEQADRMQDYRRLADAVIDAVETGRRNSYEEFLQFDQDRMQKAYKPFAAALRDDPFVQAYMDANAMQRLSPEPVKQGWLTDRDNYYKQLGVDEKDINVLIKAGLASLHGLHPANAGLRMGLAMAARGWQPVVPAEKISLTKLDAGAMESVDRIITLGGFILAGVDRSDGDYRGKLLGLRSTDMLRNHARHALEAVIQIRAAKHVTDDSKYDSPRLAELLKPLAAGVEYDYLLLSDAVVKLTEAVAQIRRAKQPE